MKQEYRNWYSLTHVIEKDLKTSILYYNHLYQLKTFLYKYLQFKNNLGGFFKKFDILIKKNWTFKLS